MASKEARRSVKSAQLNPALIGLNSKVQAAGKVFVDADVTVGTDSVEEVAHGLVTGDRVQLTSSGTLPAGLALATDYWIIKVDDDNIQFASSLSNADAGTEVTITAAAGGGNHTILRTDVLAGVDSLMANTIEVQSTGVYRIFFDPARPFKIADYNVQVTSLTADVHFHVSAKALTYVEITGRSIAAAPAAADGFFELVVFGSKASIRWS